jgi:competence protein ComEC
MEDLRREAEASDPASAGEDLFRRAPPEPESSTLLAALAILTGSAVAASEALPPAAARAFILGAPLVWIAFLRGWRARAHGRGLGMRMARCAPVALVLAGASALRTALELRLVSQAPSSEHRAVGAWQATGASSDREVGSLGRGTQRLAVVRGVLEPGEEIAVLAGDEAPAFARGPELGPARRSGFSRPCVERGPDEIVRLAPAEAGVAACATAPLERIRKRLLERTSRLSDPLTRGLMAGLLFGDLTELPHGVGDLFVRTGTFHILAISGMQVAFVAVLLAGPIAKALVLLLRAGSAGRLRVGFETLRAAILLFFVPVAGAGPPVTRSALAWVLGSLASSFRARKPFAAVSAPGTRERDRFMPRSSDPLSLWSLALLCECLVHPDAPLSVSVQLTYAATLGLILATAPVSGLLRRALPGGGRISPTGRTGRPRPELARVLAQKLSDAAIYAVAASIAAVLATSAFVWTQFGEWSPSGILATPAIAFPVAWILVGGWIWLLAPGLVPEGILDVAGRGMVGLLEALDRIPGTPSPIPPRPFLLLTLAACLTMAALVQIRARRGGSGPERTWIPRAAAAAWATALLPWTLAPAGLEVHALDVGHGTATLVREPGGAVWVFDAGSRDRPGVDREALGPLLRAWEVSRIGIVLSHPDRDHDGALDWLVERYPPAVWVGALPARVDARLPHTSLRIDVRRGTMRLPDLDPGALGPRLTLSRGLDVEGNEGSRFLEVAWGGEHLILCGDAEAEGLSAWLTSYRASKPLRLLLFPHHGSETDLLGPLLAALRPSEVWISTSGNPAVSRELARRGVRVRSTSAEGPLRLELP